MPGRRRRKRRRPQQLDCESLPKRQEFVMHSALKQLTDQTQAGDESQDLALVVEECEEEAATYVTLLEHLSLALPAELMGSLQMNERQPCTWFNTLAVYNSNSVVLKAPSFCIGRFSIALANGANLEALLSQVSCVERNVCTNLLLCSDRPGYIEFSSGQNDSVYLPITTDLSLCRSALSDCPNISFSAWYRVQLILCETEREESANMTIETRNRNSEQGGCDSIVERGGDLEMREQGASTHEREADGPLGGEGLADGEVQIVRVENSGQIEEGEGGREVGEMQVAGERQGEHEEECGAEGREGVSVMMGSGCVEVWVEGVMCEPSDPNALPSSGSSINLAKIVKMFHPHVSVEAKSNAQALSPSVHSRSSSLTCIEQFYKDVKQRKGEMFGGEEPAFDTSSILGLTAELCGYQERAVQWMMDREKGVEQGDERSRQLHPLWRELSVPGKSPSTLYCNPHTGRVTTERYCPPPPPLGGILADEMGLGKTVEVLTLILANRAPETITSSSNVREAEEREGTPEQGSSVQPSQHPVTSLSPSKTSAPKSLAGSLTDTTTPTASSLDSAVLAVDDVVQCVCGATSEGQKDEREYVQCEQCEVWQHSQCVRFNAARHPSFACIKCLLEKPLTSRATLIISPQSILQQWREEIEKHTSPGALSVMHYEGAKHTVVSPYDMAACDVVLVTYETLALELNYAKCHEVCRVLRRRKRYGTAPSPLPAVNWWRVCLDEAQMVESAVTKPAEMCLRLQAVHRWCVTGTPIQKDLGDLYGLVLFLNMEPYSQGLWYRRLITEPYLQGYHRPMIDLFSTIMWRNAKEDVAEELQLPEQTEQIHWLTFSLVEGYFYKKQQEMCKNEATKVLSWLGLSNLTLDTVQLTVTPLHSLRRACCHPQMVRRGGYIPISNKKSLTMAQLLDKLIVQAKAEAREGLRKLILSYNGLAGLYILQEEWRLAHETYLQAITTWTEYKEKEVECDRLQRIHTLENLAWLVEEGHSTEGLVGAQDECGDLKEKAKELRVQFMGKVEGRVRAAVEAVVACRKTIRDLQYQANRELAHYLGQIPEPMQLESDVASSSTLGAVSATSGDSSTRQTSGQDIDTSNQDTGSQMQDGSTSNQDTGNQMQDSSTSNQDTDNQMRDSSTSNQDVASVHKTENSSSLNQEHSSNFWDIDTSIPKMSPSLTWCEAAGVWIIEAGKAVEEQLIKTINFDLQDAPNCQLGQLSMRGSTFKEMSGLQFLTSQHITVVECARGTNLEVLHKLIEPPSDLQVEQAVLCHLSKRGEQRESEFFKCDLCVAESALVEYGTKLFSDYHSSTSTVQGHGEGSRGVHMFEKIVRSFLTFLRHKHAPKGLMDSGKAFVAYFDAIKKEYDALRTLWQMLRQRVSECDELRLAGTRMRYMTCVEMAHGTDDMSAVHPTCWTIRKKQFELEKALATTELTRALGQVIYLKNLAETPENHGNCPICTRLLGKEIDQWGMLPCGHPLCVECVLELTRMRQYSFYCQGGAVRLSCPLCRFSFLSTEINAVRPSQMEDVDEHVKGSPSTKILGVIRTLLAIKRESPTAKTLVFSTWLETLTLISASLTANGLGHSYLKTSRTFQDNLSVFKKSKNVNILLLPLHSGSKGLNLVEATHVILVEPVLNISAELQAIGRVHRMGQTKPTTVHRLLIRDSVEEKIHHLLTNTHNKTKFFTQREGQSTLTVSELRALFH